MKKIQILKKLKREFIKEDNKENFLNRDYADETIRIFDMLINGYDDLTESQTDRAINDIVSDIFRYFKQEDYCS